MTEFTYTNHPALYYESMLADRVRMRRYRRAIAQVLRPGDVVADLGTGLGVLALMAAQAGAARVYAVDNRAPVLDLAARVLAANPGGERVRLVAGDARELQLDEPVDLIVNELIGDFGTDENIWECVAGFARRNLRPGGRILPRRLRTRLAPVEYRGEFRGVWGADWQGLDLRPAIQAPCRPGPVLVGLRHRPRELAPPALLEDARFGPAMGKRDYRPRHDFTVAAAGEVQGFVGWFEAELADGIGLANYPCYPSCHWVNWNWPLTPPVPVAPGDRLRVALDARPNMVAAGWGLDWTLQRRG